MDTNINSPTFSQVIGSVKVNSGGKNYITDSTRLEFVGGFKPMLASGEVATGTVRRFINNFLIKMALYIIIG